ncbi:hypothetical protein AB0L35_35165 [Streptomyces sp. NPDC052309]|uniref:Uncharacterized protein n=1 Tax=Streptomyces griseicoloratus TaxID=2752516 RepID=A0A926QR19_9ACTN|nr:hypothetical protein [Streptomyces griseicoloratus]MBD0420190.1 hypothetical protein [Streptomyces griseicoloratus]
MDAEQRLRSSVAYGKPIGFVLVLGALCALFYVVGRAAGPVSPELRPGWHYPRDEISHSAEHAR